jgi:short-subunit dehydrogenase
VPPLLKPKHILITGASSGIGKALAEGYAAPGVALALSGRDQNRLDNVALSCQQLGAEVSARVIDVAERADMAQWITDTDAARPLDLVIANAGISAGSGSSGEDEEQVRNIFSVNMAGVLNTLWPAIHLMRRRRQGQLAIISSLVGFRGLPGAPAYSASKAAVLAYGDGLRGMLHDEGIDVSVVCPGFVKSRITDANDFHMPFLMTAEKAAMIIHKGLAQRKARIVFPKLMHWAIRVIAALPVALSDPILRRAPRKA